MGTQKLAPTDAKLGGVQLLPEREFFVQWLSVPRAERKPTTLQQLAKKLRVHRVTLWRWGHDEEIIREVRKRIRTLALNYLPGAVRKVGERAENEGDVSAAKFIQGIVFPPDEAPVNDQPPMVFEVRFGDELYQPKILAPNEEGK